MQVNINILNELKEAGAATLIKANNKNHYSVPAEYFSDLPAGILSNIFISKLPVTNPYAVPEAYFKNLPDIIFERINAPVLLTPSKKEEVFAVPNGYFDGFANSVVERIKAHNHDDIEVGQELEMLSPLLSSIPKNNVYSIPAQYFDELAPLKNVAVEDKSSAKVISLGSKTRTWLNYAAAACISAVLFGGGYLFVSGNKPKPMENTNQPAVATSASPADFQQQLAGLSDSEIESYLKENSNMAVYTNTSIDEYQRQNQNSDIKTLIEDIPDDEIQQYLNEGDVLKKEEGI